MAHVYSALELEFLRQLWFVSPELHDLVAKMFREGTTLAEVKIMLRKVMDIVGGV